MVNFLKFNVFFYILDIPVPRQTLFQDPATGIMEGIIDLHHDLFFFLCLVSFFVLALLVQIVYFFELKINKQWFPITIRHDALIEIIWTIIPTLILVFVAIPSFALLYAIDEIHDPLITVKAVGHQWFWHYEYSDPYLGKTPIVFESRMVPLKDLIQRPGYRSWGQLRLLETDNRVVLPEKVNIRLLTTSVDVLHSWAVPSFGIKIDACPGRLNEVGFYIKRTGAYYGQCSEICGVNHGFMPISVFVVDLKNFLVWESLKVLSATSSKVLSSIDVAENAEAVLIE